MEKRNSVLIGMSGGVDSSVSALLLKQQGYDVYGVTFKLSDDQDPLSFDYASKVAKDLEIKHEVVDITKEFKKEVIDYFLKEYQQGRTPNPCVICNRKLKFHQLIRYADQKGIDFVATGHYVRVDKNNQRYFLRKAVDLKRDQSYFLYRLTQEQLKRSIFPLGNLGKNDVRDIAKKSGLIVADKKDSQDICFIHNGDYRSFVKNNSNISFQSGDIINMKGEKIGTHSGLFKYTIGQRKGLGISSTNPLYVIDLDPSRNVVVVGSESDLYSNDFEVSDVNPMAVDSLDNPLEVTVKVRSSSIPVPAVIASSKNGNVLVKLHKRQRAVTSGQSAVFYENDILVAGGIIV